MQSNPIASLDFGPKQRLALALAGTVALPSPFPAWGRVYLGINPHHNPMLPGGSPRFFLKIVQFVSIRQVITRIFDLDALRAVSLVGDGEKEGACAPREPEPVEEYAEQIAFARRWLEEGADGTGVFELSLFPKAVLHVPEATPMLVRIQYEYGVLASECAENVRIVDSRSCMSRDEESAGSPAPWAVELIEG